MTVTTVFVVPVECDGNCQGTTCPDCGCCEHTPDDAPCKQQSGRQCQDGTCGCAFFPHPLALPHVVSDAADYLQRVRAKVNTGKKPTHLVNLSLTRDDWQLFDTASDDMVNMMNRIAELTLESNYNATAAAVEFDNVITTFPDFGTHGAWDTEPRHVFYTIACKVYMVGESEQ